MVLGFTKSKADSNFYFKVEYVIPLILLICFNDLFLTSDEEIITHTRRRLSTEFEMKDIGMMHYFLGMEVWQSEDRSMQWRF